MEELENNTKEEAMRLEVVSKNIEGMGKFLWDSTKKVEKIQTDLDAFTTASRKVFDAFAAASRREFETFVQENFEAMARMQKLCNDLGDEIQRFQDSGRIGFIAVIVTLVLVIVFLCVK